MRSVIVDPLMLATAGAVAGATALLVWRVGRIARAWRADAAYRNALRELQRSPADPEARERALAEGRAYCKLVRGGYALRTFDETDVRTDVAAATASTVPAVGEGASDETTRRHVGTVEERLRRISALIEQGLVTEAEAAARKREILREI